MSGPPDRIACVGAGRMGPAAPGGSLAVVGVGEVPNLLAWLAIEIREAWWAPESEEIVLTIDIHNSGDGELFLGPDFIQNPEPQQETTEGGDAYEGTWQVTPRLPIVINPGETAGITVSFLPQFASMRLQIGADLWEVGGFPRGFPAGIPTE